MLLFQVCGQRSCSLVQSLVVSGFLTSTWWITLCLRSMTAAWSHGHMQSTAEKDSNKPWWVC